MPRIILFTVVLLSLLVSPSFASKPPKIKTIRADKKKIVVKTSPQKISASDFNCLAKNIYFEARGESVIGQIAIGLVTLERKQSSSFPSTICDVVREDSAFSWTSTPHKVRNQEAYDKAKTIASIAILIKELGLDILRADHFHSINLSKYPRWSYRFEQVAVIGNHVFYRSDI